MAKAICGEKGFSYVEAMIVILIIGLFSAMALPAFENILARERLKSTARTITIHLREISHLAIAKEKPLKIVFTSKNFGGTEKGTVYRVKEESVVLERYTLPHDIVISSVTFPSQSLNFNPLGTATPGRIELESPSGDKFYIIVNSVGRVRTSNVPPEGS
jgi:Tfp pilus assembly protein FimT